MVRKTLGIWLMRCLRILGLSNLNFFCYYLYRYLYFYLANCQFNGQSLFLWGDCDFNQWPVTMEVPVGCPCFALVVRLTSRPALCQSMTFLNFCKKPVISSNSRLHWKSQSQLVHLASGTGELALCRSMTFLNFCRKSLISSWPVTLEVPVSSSSLGRCDWQTSTVPIIDIS